MASVSDAALKVSTAFLRAQGAELKTLSQRLAEQQSELLSFGSQIEGAWKHQLSSEAANLLWKISNTCYEKMLVDLSQYNDFIGDMVTAAHEVTEEANKKNANLFK